MRLFVSVACLLLMVGCAGPHSTGGLWAQQNLELELVNGRQSDAERAANIHAYELTLADESLNAERSRVELSLQDCPGAVPKALGLSAGDRVRDTIRLRIGDDAQRQLSVAQVALADWRVRRAQATGEAHFCAEARQALAASTSSDARAADSPPIAPSATDVLTALGSATVTRVRPPAVGVAAEVTSAPNAPGTDDDALAMVSNYALGYVDTVRARAPLPQYLAAVYGGVLVDVDSPPKLNIWVPSLERPWTTEAAVDLLAPGCPQWEPDAIYAALLPA